MFGLSKVKKIKCERNVAALGTGKRNFNETFRLVTDTFVCFLCNFVVFVGKNQIGLYTRGDDKNPQIRYMKEKIYVQCFN